MVNSFDQLDQVRSAAEARARESFEYFVNSVLGAHMPEQLCEDMQRAWERKVDYQIASDLPYIRMQKLRDAWTLWLALIGGTLSACTVTRPETFTWLFGEKAA